MVDPIWPLAYTASHKKITDILKSNSNMRIKILIILQSEHYSGDVEKYTIFQLPTF